ncbi:hypothetical protein Trisim1_010275 [Trichoderma cf. simile WF8]
MKVIAFSQDVRPPNYGTTTFKPFALGKGNMHKLAGRSMGRRLPHDYDYDSATTITTSTVSTASTTTAAVTLASEAHN